MKKYPTIFNLIAEEFRNAQIPCILIGGFAVNRYHVSRHTGDVDFLIRDEDFSRVSELLIKSGYEKISSDKVFARFGNHKFHFMDADFMFVDQRTFEGMMKEGEQAEIAAQKFTVPSLNHLIALKLHSIKFNAEREYKDLLDIMQLVKMNQVNIRTDRFKSLCLKYGTEVLYNKILNLKS